MGVTSIRLNQKEEKLLKYLKDHYSCDASTLLKKSLWEMYEDIKDKEIVENFEKLEKTRKTRFVSIDDLL